MKKYISIITVFFALVAMNSCTNEGREFDTNDGKGLSFVHLNGSSQTLAAKPGANTATITISATHKSDQARTYTLNVDPTSTAKEGTHYTLSSKTVTIPAGQYAGSVTLTANLDNLTPETVAVSFSFDSNDAIEYGKNMKVSMYLFFEVTWDWILGTWKWTDDEWVGQVSFDRLNGDTITITNIWDYGMSIKAVVDFSTARIIILPNQKFCMNYIEDGEDYKGLFFDAITGDSYTNYSTTEPIIGSCSYTGIITTGRWTPMLLEAGYYWGAFYTTVLSRPN